MPITILIHTYKRPECAKKLLESIKKYYPDIPVIVYDDTEYDRGLSWGRNYLVSQAKTKYVFICDDDCVFNERTRLEDLLLQLESEDLDMVSLSVPNAEYHGVYDVSGDVVYMNRTDGLCDFVINCFLAKRESLIANKWDERLKIGEHFAYFFEHRGKMRIKHNISCDIGHEHIDTPEYRKDRNRAWDLLYMYMREKGLKKRVGIDGSIVVVPDYLLRNDDISIDTNIGQLREVQMTFYKYGLIENYSVVPFGKSEVLKHSNIQAMSWQQIEELTGKEPLNGEVVDFLKDSIKRGSKIILHGHTHTKLGDMEESEIRTRLSEGKQYLESLLNCDIEYYAAPFNYITEKTRNICEELGLKILDESGDQLERCVKENLRTNQPFGWYHYWRFYEHGLSVEMLDRWLSENSRYC